MDMAEEALRHVIPALHARLAELPDGLREIAEYHFGWNGPDDEPAVGVTSRMRLAVLTMLCARVDDGPWERGIQPAVAWTLLLHQTRIHDDVVDEEPVRYGRPAVWREFGVASAIQAGNALLALAFSVLARHGGPAAVRSVDALGSTVIDASAGQLMDLASEGTQEVDTEQYLRIVAAKTASGIATAVRLGVLSTTAGPAQAEAMTRFGRHLGVAVQVHNDLEDLWANPVPGCAPLRSDLVRRKKTLPLIMARLGGADRATVTRFFRADGPPSRQQIDAVADIIERAGGRQLAEDAMRESLTAALESLGHARISPRAAEEITFYLDTLFTLPDITVR